MDFVHLHVHSPFSFLDGASRLEELVDKAAALGMKALALTDHDNVAGAPFFQERCQRMGIRPIIGAEVTLEQGFHLVLLAKNTNGYANLCRLLTRAHLDHPRGQPRVTLASLQEYHRDLIALSGCRKGEIPFLLLRKKYREALARVRQYQDIFGRDNFYLELEHTMLPGDRSLNHCLAQLSQVTGAPLVATNNVHYAEPEQFPVHDLLTCVRTLTRLEDIHPDRPLNQENYLKTPAEMQELFRDYPEAVQNTLFIAERCEQPLDLSAKHYPEFSLPPGETAESFLRRLVYEGARRRYGKISRRVRERLEYELSVINELGYADYFLLVWDVADFARRQGIRYAGRGSAADSLVSYCLYITEVDALQRGLLFERFMSRERGEQPDIDIDFDARYRDRVADYVYRKYGAEHVASVGTYNTFQARSAIRDLGRAMGFAQEELDRIAKLFPHAHADAIPVLLERLPELRQSDLKGEKYQRLFHFCGQVAGLPRFMGTHLGGLVISRRPLTDITPLQRAAKGVVVTQFDKEGVEILGLLKLDLLSLRMMSVLEDTIRVITRKEDFREEKIPPEDKATFQMINRGETIGVFQLESPAQRALQQRLNASIQEDLVASLALIRPGPIKGNMVEPFIRRKLGLEEVTYLHPKLEPILKKTRGVILFQEQVIEIATAIAGFTPGEADRMRRVMSHSCSQKEMEELGKLFVAKAQARGVDKKVAEEIFGCILGYASYGFCEAHAAAFANTAYRSAYLACHYPAYYFAALLSHQPMGYYDANTLCVEARRRGIAILPPDINKSGGDFVVENGAIRVSLAQVKGMSREILQAILAGQPYTSIVDFQKRIKAPRHILENLILSGAFDGLHPNRKQLLWQVPLLEQIEETGFLPVEEEQSIDDFAPWEKHRQEKEVLGIDIRCHPMTYYRQWLEQQGFQDSRSIKELPPGAAVKIAGILVRPHRPPTKSGKTVVFFSVEDEHGLADVTVFEDIYQRYGQEIFGKRSGLILVEGTIQDRDRGHGIIAARISRWQLTYLVGT